MISPQCSHFSHSPSVRTLRSPSSVLSDVFSRVNQAITNSVCHSRGASGLSRGAGLGAPSSLQNYSADLVPLQWLQFFYKSHIPLADIMSNVMKPSPLLLLVLCLV